MLEVEDFITEKFICIDIVQCDRNVYNPNATLKAHIEFQSLSRAVSYCSLCIEITIIVNEDFC